MAFHIEHEKREVFTEAITRIANTFDGSLKRRFAEDLILAYAHLKEDKSIQRLLKEQDEHPQSHVRRQRLINALKTWGQQTNNESWIDSVCK